MIYFRKWVFGVVLKSERKRLNSLSRRYVKGCCGKKCNWAWFFIKKCYRDLQKHLDLKSVTNQEKSKSPRRSLFLGLYLGRKFKKTRPLKLHPRFLITEMRFSRYMWGFLKDWGSFLLSRTLFKGRLLRSGRFFKTKFLRFSKLKPRPLF